MGFDTNPKTKPLIIGNLADSIIFETTGIKSNRSVEQLYTYIWKNGKMMPLSGYAGDLVIANALALEGRRTIKFRSSINVPHR